MHFDVRYLEQLRLDDGSAVTLRLVRPEDKALLEEGFASLSAETRYRRFLEARTRLTQAELHYLTELDGDHHFAIGAAARGEDGREHGVGIARFVKLDGRPEVAEPAVTVADAWQGRGLGRVLVARLAAAAHERGVRLFRTTVLSENRPVRALIEAVAPDAHMHSDAGVLTIEFPVPQVALPSPDESVHKASLFRLLALAARRLLPV